MQLEVVKLPRRWAVERSTARATCFRRLARNDERLAETRAGWHFVTFAILMLKRFVELIVESA
jgi:transposase